MDIVQRLWRKKRVVGVVPNGSSPHCPHEGYICPYAQHEGLRVSGDIAPIILHFGTKWTGSLSTSN